MSLTYSVQVFPHHTDYAGVVWHGTYLTWLESARITWLQSAGIDYADLVATGIELPVMALTLKYHRAAKMGDHLQITATCDRQGVRLIWQCQIFQEKHPNPILSAEIILAVVDMPQGKILRHLPAPLEQAIQRLVNISKLA